MELRLLECLAALLLFLSIIRPLLRGLWKLPGLTACPLLALGILAGIFPAYGFRPECIPLLLFAFFLVIVNIPDFTALFSGLQSDSYRDRGLPLTLGSAAAFAFALWITVYFAPPMDTELSAIGVKTLFLQGGELHVRIYGPAEENRRAGNERPLLILLPPVAGSFTVSDGVCSALRDRGFTVLCYSRLNFDSPSVNQNGMTVRLFIPGLFRLGNALTRGLSDVAANARGRELEAVRRQDTLFLLRELSENKSLLDLLAGTNRNMVFLAGYGAGGAALTVLAGQDGFAARYPQIRGIAAIEAPLLSSLEGDPLPEPPPPALDPVSAFYQQISEYAKSFLPREITHITETPHPAAPVLFILSDRVINERGGRYATILRTLGAAQNAALIAAVPGAGPFDYSGSPEHYPVLSFLFRGVKQTEKNRNWPELTASLITNFAVFILENEAAGAVDVGPVDTGSPESILLNSDILEDGIPPKVPLARTALDNAIYLEQGGVWHIPNIRTILQP